MEKTKCKVLKNTVKIVLQAQCKEGSQLFQSKAYKSIVKFCKTNQHQSCIRKCLILSTLSLRTHSYEWTSMTAFWKNRKDIQMERLFWGTQLMKLSILSIGLFLHLPLLHIEATYLQSLSMPFLWITYKVLKDSHSFRITRSINIYRKFLKSMQNYWTAKSP